MEGLPTWDQCKCDILFDVQLKVPTTEKPTVTVNFRKLLLNRCQKEFEKDKDDDEVFEKKQKEMDEAATVRENPPTHCPSGCYSAIELGVGLREGWGFRVFWRFLCLEA